MKFLFNPAPKLASVDLMALFLRLVVGILMLTHGLPKFERFLNGDHQFADPFGLGSDISMALAIFAEVICSILIIIGLLTRAAVIPLLITMLTAALIVHADDPFGKKELGLLYFILYVVIFWLGSGKYSADFAITKSADEKKKKRKRYKNSRPANL